MNWEQVAGQWNQTKGSIKSKWAKLTHDDLTMLEAKKDALVGKIEERYGILKDAAEKQVDEWIAELSASHGDKAAKHAKEKKETEEKPHGPS